MFQERPGPRYAQVRRECGRGVVVTVITGIMATAYLPDGDASAKGTEAAQFISGTTVVGSIVRLGIPAATCAIAITTPSASEATVCRGIIRQKA